MAVYHGRKILCQHQGNKDYLNFLVPKLETTNELCVNPLPPPMSHYNNSAADKALAAQMDDTTSLPCTHKHNCACTATEHSKDRTDIPPDNSPPAHKQKPSPSHHLIPDTADFVDSVVNRNYVKLFAGTASMLQYHAHDLTTQLLTIDHMPEHKFRKLIPTHLRDPMIYYRCNLETLSEKKCSSILQRKLNITPTEVTHVHASPLCESFSITSPCLETVQHYIFGIGPTHQKQSNTVQCCTMLCTH